MGDTSDKQTLTGEELTDFLNSKMRMSHIYQPLLIRTLIENGGKASIRDIAREFLAPMTNHRSITMSTSPR